MRNEEIIIEIVDEPAMEPTLDAEIRNLLIECFPADREYYSKQRWWHSRPAWSVVAFSGGKLIAHESTIERTVFVGRERKPVLIGGVQNFCVKTDHRGTGLSDRIMAAAMTRMLERGLDAGLLFCLPVLEKVYNRMGWLKLDVHTFIQDEGGLREIPAKNITMACPAEKFPAGDIYLAGDDW